MALYPRLAAHLQIDSRLLNGAVSPINWAKKIPGPFIVVIIFSQRHYGATFKYVFKIKGYYYTTNFFHFRSADDDATAFSIKAIPLTPS